MKLTKNSEIHNVMTLCPHSVGLDQPVSTAHELMRKYNIRHLPVQQAGKLIGIVSDRDIQFALGYAQKADNNLGVEDVYIPEPFIVEPTTRIIDVAKRMAADKIGCTIIANDGKLVGIFTTVDACRVLTEVLS